MSNCEAAYRKEFGSSADLLSSHWQQWQSAWNGALVCACDAICAQQSKAAVRSRQSDSPTLSEMGRHTAAVLGTVLKMVDDLKSTGGK